MTRILFIQPSLSGISSVEKIIPLVAKGLRDNGFDIVSASFYDPLNYRPEWSTCHDSISELPTKGALQKVKKVIKRCRFILRSINKTSPDVIIISTHGSSLIGLLLKFLRLVKVPIIIYVHQALSASDKGYMTGTKVLYHKADGYICVSHGVAEEVENLLTSTAIPITVAYNPVLSKKDNNKILIKQTKSINPILISVSRLEPIRGVDILVELCCKYFKYNPGELWVLGDGSLKKIIEKKVHNEQLSHRIHFTGTVLNVEEYLIKSDIYISFARAEALGVALIESLAVGVPVICTDVPYGPREVMSVTDQITSYPHRTEYGYLLKPVYSTNSEAELDELYKQFSKSVSLVIENKSIFPPEKLIKRSLYFSIENAVVPVVNIINLVLKKQI